eukprot:2494401-Rhodomonas_salina.2
MKVWIQAMMKISRVIIAADGNNRSTEVATISARLKAECRSTNDAPTQSPNLKSMCTRADARANLLLRVTLRGSPCPPPARPLSDVRC